MQKQFILFVALGLLLAGCQVYQPALKTACANCPTENGSYEHAEELKPLFEALLAQGVPGIAVAIHGPNQTWEYARKRLRNAKQPALTIRDRHNFASMANKRFF